MQFGATTGAIAVTSLLVALAPPFLTSVQDRLVEGAVASDPEVAQVRVSAEIVPDRDGVERFRQAVTRTLGDVVAQPVTLIEGRTAGTDARIWRGSPDGDERLRRVRDAPVVTDALRGSRNDTRLFARNGAVDALDVGADGSADGLWVSRVVADEIGLSPDDSLLVSALVEPEEMAPPSDGVPRPERLVTEVPIAGIYEGPFTGGLSPYWQQVPERSLPRQFALIDSPPVPQLLVGREDVVLDTAAAIGASVRLTMTYAPAGPSPSAAHLDRIDAATRRLAGALVADGDVGRSAGLLAGAGGDVDVFSDLDDAIADARAVRDGIASDVTAMLLAGLVLAGGTLLAAGVLRARQNSDERRLLWSQGLSLAARAGQDLVGLLPATVAGAVLGVAGVWGLVVAFGGRVPAAALEAAARRGAAAAVGAAIVLVAVGARWESSRRRAQHRLERGGGLTSVLVGLVVITVIAFAVVLRRGDAAETDLLVQALPVLGVLCAAATGSAAVAWLGRRLRVPRAPGRGLLLARLRSGGPSSALVVISAAAAVGVVVQATVLLDSAQRSVADQAAAEIGAEAAVVLRGAEEVAFPAIVAAIEGEATLVHTGLGDAQPGAVSVAVRIIDAASFAEQAEWRSAFTPAPGTELGTLPGDGGTVVPALLAGVGTAQVADTGSLLVRDQRLAYEVAVRLPAAPRQDRSRPTLYLDREAVLAGLPISAEDPILRRQGAIAALDQLDREVLTDLPLEQLVARLLPIGVDDPARVELASAITSAPGFVGRLQALRFLQVVAVVAATSAAAALLLHVRTRSRRRTLAADLLARMGMTSRARLLVEVVEMVAMGVGGAALGLPAALVSLRLLLPALDVAPAPPGPSLALRPDVIVVVVVVPVLVGLGVALLSHHWSEHGDVADALRTGG